MCLSRLCSSGRRSTSRAESLRAVMEFGLVSLDALLLVVVFCWVDRLFWFLGGAGHILPLPCDTVRAVELVAMGPNDLSRGTRRTRRRQSSADSPSMHRCRSDAWTYVPRQLQLRAAVQTSHLSSHHLQSAHKAASSSGRSLEPLRAHALIQTAHPPWTCRCQGYRAR